MENSKQELSGYDGIFAERLRNLMIERKIKQNEIATQTGTTRQAISQYMDGSILPSSDKLLKICQFLNVSANYLLGIDDAINVVEQDICSRIGLSSKSVETLISWQEAKKANPKKYDATVNIRTATLDFLIRHEEAPVPNKEWERINLLYYLYFRWFMKLAMPVHEPNQNEQYKKVEELIDGGDESEVLFEFLGDIDYKQTLSFVHLEASSEYLEPQPEILTQSDLSLIYDSSIVSRIGMLKGIADKETVNNLPKKILQFIQKELDSGVYTSLIREYRKKKNYKGKQNAVAILEFIKSEVPEVYKNLMTAYEQREATNGKHPKT